MELVSDVLFMSGGLSCWYTGGMRSIALSQLMMLSGIQDGKGSGIGESCSDKWFTGLSAGLSAGEWVIVSIK